MKPLPLFTETEMVSKLSLVAEKLLERELEGSFKLKRGFDWCTYKREAEAEAEG